MFQTSYENITEGESNYVVYSELSIMDRRSIGGCNSWTITSFGDLYIQNQLMRINDIKYSVNYNLIHSDPNHAIRFEANCSNPDPSKEFPLGKEIVKVLSGETTSYSTVCGATTWKVAKCTDERAAFCLGCSDPCADDIDDDHANLFRPCHDFTSSNKTAVRHLLLSFIPPKPAPMFNATVYNFSTTSVTLRLSLEDRGLAACGSFPVNSNITGSFMIYMQRNQEFVGNSSSLIADITIEGLTASTRYDFYCTTASTDNVELELPDILTRKITKKTACCKASTVSWSYLVLSELKHKGGAIDAVKFEMESGPEKYIAYNVGLVSYHDDTIFPLIPGKLEFFGNASFSTVQYLSIGSDAMEHAILNDIKNMSLSISVMGVSKSDHSLSMESPSIKIITANDEPPTPSLLSVTFSSTGNSLMIEFDSETDMAGISAPSFSCSLLFIFANSSSTVCQWSDSRSLVASLGSTSTVLPDDDFRVIANKLKAKCTLANIANCKGWKYVASAEVNIAKPSQVLLPNVIISAPFVLSKCDRLTLDISSSTGSGGRKWADYDFVIVDGRNETANDPDLVNSPVQTARMYFKSHFSVSPPMKLPSGVLEISMYKIEVSLTNFLGGVGSSSLYVLVVSKAVPFVSILGESIRSITRRQMLSLTAMASITQCSGNSTKTSTSNLEFEWEISSNDEPLYEVTNTAKAKTAYKLLPFTLSAGKMYEVKLSVLYTVGLTSSSSKTSVYVMPSNLVAVVAGGGNRGMKPGETLVLDGGNSYDEDVGPNETPDYEYSWGCMTTSPRLDSNCALSFEPSESSSFSVKKFAAPASSILTMPYLTIFAPLGILEESEYRIRLTVYDQTRSDYADVYVKILDPGQPAVSITSSFNQRFNPTKMLVIEGSVTAVATEPASCTWSATSESGNNVDLTSVSLTPLTTIVPKALTDNIMFGLSANSLPERFKVTFFLQCKKAVATVQIETNGPPISGTFSITPSEGAEFNDQFLFSAALWIDDDLPLSYAFSFGENRNVIKAQGASSYTESSLPAGEQTNNYTQNCFTQIYDSLGAVAEDESQVVVRRLILPTYELNKKLSGAFDDAMNSTDPNVLVSLLSVSSSMVNFVECAESPDCSSLHRELCKDTPNTCGSCLTNFIGASGDSNAPCADMSLLARRKLSECDSDTDCDVLSTCKDGICELKQKECLHNCSDVGECISVDSSTGDEIDECSLMATTCEAICICRDGFAGSSCSLSEDDLQSKQSMRKQMMQGITSAEVDEDSVAIAASMTTLQSVSKKIDEMSYDNAQDAMKQALSLLDMGVKVQLDATSASSLFGTLADMTLIEPPDAVARKMRRLYAKYLSQSKLSELEAIASRRQLSSQQYPAAMQTNAVNKYSELILESLIDGQENVDIVETSLRFTSGVSKSTSAAGVNLTSPLSTAEKLQDISPYHVQLIVGSDQTSVVKSSFGVVSKRGFGDAGEDLSVNPANLYIGDMSVCGTGCRALITMPNIAPKTYIGNSVDVKKQAMHETYCDGSDYTVHYECEGSTADIDLDLYVKCERYYY